MWREVLNSDAHAYDGQGFGAMGLSEAAPFPTMDGRVPWN